uniref:alpha/beta hydrolase n=1 Tax=Streptomyces sp. CHD11 TaxID=2741325 RepID=UPI00203CDFF2|nr:alpha/beta hydrolase [Streptomyces sp. CHD11]
MTGSPSGPAQHPDPAAEGGLGPRKSLGDGSAFAGVDNGGHSVYGEASPCADKATAGFLATGHLPDKDVHCTDVTQKQPVPSGSSSGLSAKREKAGRTAASARPFAVGPGDRRITWSSPRRETGSRCESGTVPPL